jgi:maltose-binding protein MalE
VLDQGDQYGCAKVQELVLSPDEKAKFLPINISARADTQVNGGGTVRRVKLCFTDAAGVRWMRDEFGRLNELGSKLLVTTDQMRERVFKQFNEDFKATYGVEVEYDEKPDGYPQTKFVEDLLPGRGIADALIAPNDWIGDLKEHGIIEPTVISDAQRDAFVSWALNALTLERRLYGIPTTIDTVALIRNTDLAPGPPPSTFDELIDTAERLRSRGVTDLFAVRVGEGGDPFQIWPLFASAGGQLFARTAEGGWDYRDIRLATDESIAAFERLGELGEREGGVGVLRCSMGSVQAFDAFNSGRTAFLITTSDGMLKAREAGIKFAVSPVPPFSGGKPAMAFRLVHGLFMAEQGKNKAIAHDLFADYLTQRRIMETLSKNIVCPVAVRVTAADADPGIAEYQRLCGSDDSSMSMPTFPQMEQVWRIVGSAQAWVIAGAPARETAMRAKKAVADRFAELQISATGLS